MSKTDKKYEKINYKYAKMEKNHKMLDIFAFLCYTVFRIRDNIFAFPIWRLALVKFQALLFPGYKQILRRYPK